MSHGAGFFTRSTGPSKDMLLGLAYLFFLEEGDQNPRMNVPLFTMLWELHRRSLPFLLAMEEKCDGEGSRETGVTLRNT